jgi:hypothetical protein
MLPGSIGVHRMDERGSIAVRETKISPGWLVYFGSGTYPVMETRGIFVRV